jgi:long-chain acyl-CoA synthetase
MTAESRPWTRHYDYNVPTTIRYPRTTVQQSLALPANTYPDKVALDFYGSTMSFYELRQHVLRFSNVLALLGVSKGDRVGIQLPNCPQYPIAYYATLTLGAIVVNLNPLYTPEEVKPLVEETGMTTLITFDMIMPNVRALCSFVSIQRVIVTAVTDYISGMPRATAESLKLEPGWRHFSTLLDQCADTRLPKVKISSDDPAVIQFTGGTTGVPKGAVLTHANIIAAALQAVHWGGLTRDYIPPLMRSVLCVLPFFHVYGNIIAMNYSMWTCSTMILVPRFDINEIISTIGRFEKITFFPSVPTMITAIVNHPQAVDLNLGRRLGVLNSGAAPMPVELIERVKDLNVEFIEGWGMSETSSTGVFTPLVGMKKPGSIGIPSPDVDIRIADINDSKREVKQGEAGELLIRGPMVMQGYWNRPKETAEELVDGWLHTGDVVVQDEDGYLFIVDRKKDMVIAGGYNIYPREIDEVLFQHPKIMDAVAVGIPDEYRGETIKAFIVLRPGQSATEKEIIDFCRSKLAAYKAPKLVEFRESLPKSAVGKILRKILRAEEEAKLKPKATPR